MQYLKTQKLNIYSTNNVSLHLIVNHTLSFLGNIEVSTNNVLSRANTKGTNYVQWPGYMKYICSYQLSLYIYKNITL